MKDVDFGLYLIHIAESLRNVLEYTKDIEPKNGSWIFDSRVEV